MRRLQEMTTSGAVSPDVGGDDPDGGGDTA